MKYLVFFALMVSFAGAQELKDFEGVYLSGRDSTHPNPMVIKIEQVPKGVKFTEYEMYPTYEINNVHEYPVVHARVYVINGKYVKDKKEHSKVKAEFKSPKLTIHTIMDWTDISEVFGGIRNKNAEEWSLTRDLQTLMLSATKELQSVDVQLPDDPEYDPGLGYYALQANNRWNTTSQRVYKRRNSVTTALAEAAKN